MTKLNTTTKSLFLSKIGWMSALLGAATFTVASAQSANDTVEIEEITLEGSEEGNPYADYIGNDTTSATRLGLSISETPQSVLAITSKRIEEQNLRNLEQVLQQTPGVIAQRFDQSRPSISARGFSIENYSIDNIPVFHDSTWGNGVSLANVSMYEQVEVLKGASGLLNGLGNPSASINLVRKRADSTNFTGSISTGYGTWDQISVDADISSGLNESGSVRGRAVVSFDQTGSQIDIFNAENTLIYLTGEADLGENTLLTVGGSYEHRREEGSMWGSLEMFFNDDDIANATLTNWSRSKTSSADWAYYDGDVYNVFGEIEHAINDAWTINARASYNDFEQESKLLYLFGSLDRTTGLGLFPFIGPYGVFSDNTTFDVFVDGEFELLGRDHDIVFGLTHSTRNFVNNSYVVDNTTVGAIGNFYDWDGRGYAEPDVDYNTIAFPYNDAKEERFSQFTTVRLNPTDELKVILGGQLSSYELEDFDSVVEEHEYEFIPFLGVLYDITDTFTAYVSYTSIFDPQAEEDTSGIRLEPIEGKTYELGLKSQFMDGGLVASAAIYRIEQDGLAQAIPGALVNGVVGTQAYRAAEGATSEGFEIELIGQLTEEWDMQVGFAHNNIEDADGNELNAYLPENSLKLFTTYEVPVLDGLTVGGGLNWQSETSSSSGTGLTFIQESYYTVDFLAKYRVNENWSVQLNVENVLDKTYASALEFFGQYMYGNPINGMLTVKYDF